MTILSTDPTYARLAAAGDFIAWAKALAATGGNAQDARLVFAASSRKRAEMLEKAAVQPGSVGGSTWGDALGPLAQAGQAFIDLANSRSVIGRMTGFRPGSFLTRIPRLTAGTSVTWVGEGHPLRFSQAALDSVQFTHSRVSGAVVISQELAKSSDPSAERVISRDLIRSTARFLDEQFLDPLKAGNDISPASVTYGTSPVAASGTTAAALKADLASLLAQMIAGGSELNDVYLIMSKTQAAKIGALGEVWTAGLGVNGGVLLGLPVLTLNHGMTDGDSPSEENIFAVDASEVMLADDGVEIGASDAAAVQMNSTPDSPATASTVLTSLWQLNLTAIMLQRYIRWSSLRTGAAAYISGARYGE